MNSYAPRVLVTVTTAARTALAFRFLRRRLVQNQVRSILAGSRLRLIMIVTCSAVFWSGLFALFFEGFQFLGSYVKLSNAIVEHLFGMFFLSLLIMLVFSTGIIVYTGLFQSRESGFLLTFPAASDRIFAYKFLEAMAFSSWGFLLLGSPMMVAYGISVGAPPSFYFLFLGFLLAFVLIPGSAGAIGAILVAKFLPRRLKTILWVAAISLGAASIYLGARVFQTPGDVFSPDWLDALLGRLAFSQQPLLPSRWMSKGLIEAAAGDWRQGIFYLGVTAANAGLAYLIAAVVARDLYRAGYSRVQGGRSSRRRIGWYGFDAVCHRVFGFVPRPIRLLILKDLRTFRRDPAQWSQFLIFFGLLAFYFVNIRRLGYNVQNAYWRNLLSFLNLAVTALILSTFTSRFIFPLLSLEGRNFWVLGLLPVRRAAILWGKFAFATGISLVATEILVVLSDWMLQIGAGMLLVHMAMVAILCLGLSGISVGLGARLPNLKEDDPSKIAAGFGGTLNLLVSLIFIALIVTLLALPCHVYFAGQENSGFGLMPHRQIQFEFWLGMAMLGSLAIGAIGTMIPLWIGSRSFERMEF
jgi:ABC-2 type transport system permease protein